MKRNTYLKAVLSAYFICLNLSFSTAQKSEKAGLLLDLFKISVGKYQFKDRFKLVDQTIGYTIGVSYEKRFARHWTFVTGADLSVNDNAISELKKTSFSPIDLPAKELRLGFANGCRYYLSRSNVGFYFSNVFVFNWQRNSEVSFTHDCVNCLNNSFFVYSTYALSDQLGFGYQNFIDKTLSIGVLFSYEWRSIVLQELVHGPQISLQIGFGK